MDLFWNYVSYVWVIFSSVWVIFSSCFAGCWTEVDEDGSWKSSDETTSSASSTCSGTWTYDVFLSFQGEDTRNNFVDHLYSALDQIGVITFKDDQKLRIGKHISQEVIKAIEESRFAVVIFSRNFTKSHWCLDELVKIVECLCKEESSSSSSAGLTLYPVFYNVEPSEVRRQSRSFSMAFQHGEVKFGKETEKVRRWRDALTKATKISGLHVSKTANGRESECIKQIVLDILSHTRPPPIEDLIGMDSHVGKLKSLLGVKFDDVRIIGIWGMGGIGKTTIARAVFQQILYGFEGSSFVEDVRENGDNRKSLKSLQEKLLSEVLMERQVRVCDCDDGINQIKRRLAHKRILLVLDDVNNVEQLEYLAGKHEWFGPGSRIIITTRDKHLLSCADEKYEPGLLNVTQATELFSRYAFKRSSPPEGYEKLTGDVVQYTGHLPLALKVLGSYLCGRELDVWGSALNVLTRTPNKEINRILKVSFEGLNEIEKKIFLDISCFFKGAQVDYVHKVLDSFGFEPKIGINVLVGKSLLTISKGRIQMHDLIQELGLSIVREYYPASRLWLPEEITNVTMRNTRLDAVEAIHCSDAPSLEAKIFRNMKKLRLLDIGSKFTSNEPTYLPDELRWLTWRSYPFRSLPKTATGGMSKLVALEMQHGRMKQLWVGPKMLSNLKFINLTCSDKLTMFPDVSGAPNLERLILSNCSALVEVHHSVACHKRLVYLDLAHCVRLEILPSSIQMESLETLILSHCKSLKRFPEISGDMGKLSTLYLNGCYGVDELPSSISFLTSLSVLNLCSCSSLQSLPFAICEFKCLKTLNLRDCHRLQKLPEDFGSIEQLEELQLGFSVRPMTRRLNIQNFSSRIYASSSLNSLRKLDLSFSQIHEGDIPHNLQSWCFLEELNLSNNNFIRLPASISHLSRLKVLNLSHCYELEELQDLPSAIQVVTANKCISLKELDNMSIRFERLFKIWLFDCHKLLENQESERYLANMSEQSFIQKAASMNHGSSIAVPGSKVPDWISEQQPGSKTALKLPSDWQTKIKGFAICCAFNSSLGHGRLKINFKLEKDEKPIKKPCLDHSLTGEHIWIGYIPFEFFRQLYHDFQGEDWSRIKGSLLISFSTSGGDKFLKSGAHILYKQDVQSMLSTESQISDYGDWMQIDNEDLKEDLSYDRKASVNVHVFE